MEITQSTVRANGVDVAVLEAGAGPLALCLHGFPDTAWTWRHLLPDLAAAGFRAVAPFLRGYAPSGVPADGAYQTGALAADAVALHEVLGGAGDAVLVGHDWGAMAAYGAASYAPDRWHRVVTLAVPPPLAMAGGFFDYAQLRRSFYVFLFQTPLAEPAVALDDMAFIEGLWRDWSPGYDAAEDVAHVKDALRDPANLSAAIGYYRAMLDVTRHVDSYAEQQAATTQIPPQPTLYLHGANDGALGADLVGSAADLLNDRSEVQVIDGVGHFLHLERPAEVNARIVDWLKG
jgi:pimeloyl-ACP methyl ester carboxylesterase